MSKKFRPLQRSITVACTAFIILLSIVFALVTYRLYTSNMYRRYHAQMTSILDYVQSFVDNEDMARCALSFEETEKFRETQALFDSFVDYYTDLHYLYILRAMDPGDEFPVRSICSANSTYEKLYQPENVLHLGDGDASWYPDETVQKFREIQSGTEDVFFFDPSNWGMDYTLARPLISADGVHYGLLCVDIANDELESTIYRSIYICIGVLLASGLLFTVLTVLWMRLFVTDPIRKLEKSVTAFAELSHGRRDPNELVFTPPELRIRNEVALLNDAISKMSADMRDYVKSIVTAEETAEAMQALAYQDALTHVNNKTAYDKKLEELDQKVLRGDAVFAIVMMDLNNLKGINDQYGHDHGNEYIIGSCRMLCDVFAHSPVYRVGGDEFVVVLQGRDYRSRNPLLNILRDDFRDSAERTDVDPWERFSAAVGLAVYQPGEDESADAVFRRADSEMYQIKSAMKAEMKKQQ